MRTRRVVPAFVTHVPHKLDPDTLYISYEYSTAVHLCACGCEREVVTPLSPTQWKATFDGEISLSPSIGNWGLPCRSHYVITRGVIQWAGTMSDDRAAVNRQSDHALRDAAIGAHSSWPRRLWRRLTGGSRA
ncbi:DUF6527 family protein [Demequina globuliformis]|uniref:DUF6527 family protein n=1 Tax=Demequina globuliformis TaxID=676202 RepID=UPI000A04794B